VSQNRVNPNEPDGLAWLERQADVAEAIIATRRAAQP
jgi:hypothetical protein